MIKNNVKNYKVVAYVLLKVKFDQPTDDVYELAKITSDLCKRTIQNARENSIVFRNWYEEEIAIKITMKQIVDDKSE